MFLAGIQSVKDEQTARQVGRRCFMRLFNWMPAQNTAGMTTKESLEIPDCQS
jgi:hypothetical protein